MVRKRAGFTLVEVLVALVVLALGFLGLEALALGIGRALSVAERQTEMAATASAYLEDALTQLRQGRRPADCQVDSVRYVVQRRVDVAQPTNPRVVVAVTARGAAQAEPYLLRSELYLPSPGVTNASPQAPCP